MPLLLLVGAHGQLGSDLRKAAPADVDLKPLAREDLDILDFARTRDLIERTRPDVIINTAAYVNVDRAEEEPDAAFALNSEAVRNLAEAAERAGARFVHISTDYVFDGRARSPYREDDEASPINVYGRSKLEGESHVREICTRHLIVRSSGLYGLAGSSGKGGNFVTTMLRLGRERGQVSVVNDQVLTPTSTADLAAMLWRLVDGEAQGLLHVTNAGECSWFDFARAIFELSRLEVMVKPIDTATFGAKAPRPAYSVLDNSRLERDGFGRMRPWREALTQHLHGMPGA
jgi:dTDP-4-dehydrorhamnose reductase